MNVYKYIEIQIRSQAQVLQSEGALPVELNLERIEAVPPKEDGHGDIATNAAMVLAAQAKQNPRAVAQALLPKLTALEEVEKAEIAGPGFINITLKPAVWQRIIPVILEEGLGFANSAIGKGEKVNVEYVSANPTGPMHVGHSRGAVFGDALSLLLIKAGYDVTREYYINDAGSQVDKLAESAFLRYREACDEAVGEIPEGLYPGEYLIAVGEGLKAAHQDSLLDKPRGEWLPIVKRFTLDVMMSMIKDDLAQMGIVHEVFSSEQEIRDTGKVEEAVRVLEEKDLVYTGVLEPPKGKPVPDDWEPRPQLLFKSTEFGDDSDRPIRKADGSWTYLTPDIAYHWDKIKRGYTRLVDVFGVDHAGYVKRLSAAVSALSGGSATLEVKLCQLVKFMRAGEPLKMSKRAGTFITVREVVEEVGKDVLRFIMLTRRPDQPLDFDFEKVMEQSKDNPVFYVQYAHARCRSVARLAQAEFPGIGAHLKEADCALLSDPAELALIRLMAGWPRLVEAAAVAGEPHRVAFYLQELAGAFHSLWNKGNEQNTLRFIQKDAIEVTKARLALASALATVIASGLMVLGVEPVEEMR